MRRVLPAVLLLVSGSFCQQAPPATERACLPDRPVDAYIAELHKRGKGTGNPLPNSICIFGWCSNSGVGPSDKKKEEEPQPEAPAKPRLRTRPGADESSSREGTAEVSGTIPARLETYDPVKAAHSADVGDYYFKDKNYRGALMRYIDAIALKPGDPALYLRIARAAEKLQDQEHAFLSYDAALKLHPDEKLAEEARAGRERSGEALQKQSLDPEILARDNHPDPAPCLPPRGNAR